MERVLSVLAFYALLEGTSLILCKIQITEPITSRIGTDVILQCVYSGNDQWLLLQWKKEANENNYVTISSASSTTSDVRIHSSKRQSINASLEQDRGKVTFNLFIYDLWCTDGSKYKCDITTIRNFVSMETRLTVEYPPEKPQINYDTLVIPLNETFRLSCEGQVGHPPGKLQWYSRGKHQNTYRLLRNQEIVTFDSENPCSPRVVSFINISMTIDMDGNVYRCTLKSRYLEHMQWFYFDDVLLKAPVLPPFVKVKEVVRYSERGLTDSSTPGGNTETIKSVRAFSIFCVLVCLAIV